MTQLRYSLSTTVIAQQSSDIGYSKAPYGTTTECGESNPDTGICRYGNDGRYPSGFRSTPSVSALFGATFGSFAPANAGNNAEVNGVPAAPARRRISIVSSNNRRPFGNPAASPPSNPNRRLPGLFMSGRLPITCGGIARFSRNWSAYTALLRSPPITVVKFGPVIPFTGIPLYRINSRSVRLVVGNGFSARTTAPLDAVFVPYSRSNSAGTSGATTWSCRYWLSSTGYVPFQRSRDRNGLNSSF